MKHVIALAIAAIALAGCDGSKARMKEIVLAQLKDPDSAKFGRYEQVNSKNRDWACLEVNAKTPAGGYAGARGAYFVAPAGTTDWKFSGFADTYDLCVTIIKDMQESEGGPR